MTKDGHNIDGLTRELITKIGMESPSKDFTNNIMKQVQQSTVLKFNYSSNDDKKNYLLFLLFVIGLFISYFFYALHRYKIDIAAGISKIKMPTFVEMMADYFIKLWNELSLSPFILIAFLGVTLLVVLDRLIVRYLYSF